MNLDLQALGFTQQELQERVIERLCEQLLTDRGIDPFNEDETTVASQFRKQLDDRIKQTINDTINAIAEREVLPNVSAYVENLTLQQTNQWGEKRGTPVSFTEYLVQRAQAYMQEQVDTDGKSKDESGSSYWGGKQTRITHLVHKHLHYEIETAMKEAMKIATGEIARGIHETARNKLNEIAAGLKVQVATK
jgi:hypothetical protein